MGRGIRSYVRDARYMASGCRPKRKPTRPSVVSERESPSEILRFGKYCLSDKADPRVVISREGPGGRDCISERTPAGSSTSTCIGRVARAANGLDEMVEAPGSRRLQVKMWGDITRPSNLLITLPGQLSQFAEWRGQPIRIAKLRSILLSREAADIQPGLDGLQITKIK